MRAFWMAVIGVGAVLVVFCVAIIADSRDPSLFVGAITAITTLTAGAAGHAAGAAKMTQTGKSDDPESR
jgi:hypothetical protein